MGILNGTKCYLIGNMENTADAVNWRNDITEKLSDFGVRCFDPTKDCFVDQPKEDANTRKWLDESMQGERYKEVSKFMKQIIKRDLRMVDLSHFVIANLETDKFTAGSIHELVVASEEFKPAFIVVKNKKKCPLWLVGLFDMDFVFESMTDVYIYLKKVDDGIIPVDHKYWKLPKLEWR